MKPHWYRITVFYCPSCGRSKEYRERVYGEKPEKTRYIIDSWDYCDALVGV